MFNKDEQDIQKSRENAELNRQMNRRRVLKLGGLTAGVAAVASAFKLTPFSPIHAASPAASHSVKIASLEGVQGRHYIQAVLASMAYQHFQQQLHQNHPGVFTLQEHAISVVTITSTLEEVVSVRVPIAGGAGHSFYVATFQPSTSAIIETRSGLFTPSGQNIAVIAERNGIVILDAIATPTGKFVQGTLSTSNGKMMTLDGFTAQQARVQLIQPNSRDFWGCLQSCLSSQGIPGWVLGFVAIICAAACIGTAGLGCAVCIAAAAGISGGQAGWCVSECSPR